MKKLTFGVVLLLAGCLNTTNHNPMKPELKRVLVSNQYGGCYMQVEVRKVPWWQKKIHPNTPDDQNPWMKFVKTQPKDHWFDPWSQTDLRSYGVAPLPSATPVTPLKDAEIRMLKLELKKLKKGKKQNSSLKLKDEVY